MQVLGAAQGLEYLHSLKIIHGNSEFHLLTWLMINAQDILFCIQ